MLCVARPQRRQEEHGGGFTEVQVHVARETGSVSERGMSPRLGGRVRHVDTRWLLVQGVFHKREATIPKIPGISNEADLMTKFLDGPGIRATSGLPRHEGQIAVSSQRSAADGLSWVDLDWQRTENTRPDVRHDNTVQAAQIQRSRASRERV